MKKSQRNDLKIFVQIYVMLLSDANAMHKKISQDVFQEIVPQRLNN
jgi:hypothetical protein